MSKIKFEKMEKPSEIISYLKGVLSHTGSKKKEEIYLYHYTSVDALCGILESKKIWLGSSKKMNDQFEKDLLENKGICNRLFYLCCSTTGDNISLWNMYGKNNGVMIAIPFSYAEEILTTIQEENENDILEIQEAYWTAIAYYGREETKKGNRLIKTGSVFNKNIKDPIHEKEFAGFLKSKGWSNENEVRLSIVTKNDNTKPHIEVSLPEDFYKKCNFYLSPLISEKKIFDIHKNIHMIDDRIEIKNSAYMGEILPTED